MKSSPKLHSRFLTSAPPARFWRKLAGLGVVVLMMLSQTAGRAENHDQLDFKRGFLVTGNYVVGGVDLTENTHPIVNGFSEGTIPITGVPAEADIVAAYLFWETITLTSDVSQAAGVMFRGTTLDIDDVNTVSRTSEPLSGSTASCWSSGVPLSRHIFRADVLRLLPVRQDKNNKPTIKRLVNDADLLAHNLPLNTVTLPVRDGNSIPESAGATLFVVFRDPSQPLRRIVLYDGNRPKEDITVAIEQEIQGFYKSAATASALITHLVASGQPNNNDRIAFKGHGGTYSDIALNPFGGGSASQRGWANPTYNVSDYMSPAANPTGYGETVTTKIYHQPGNGGNDCLTSAAVIFSTAVADVDNDGLPDGLEDASGGLKDPNDTELPNLSAMGASSSWDDMFIEINAMWAAVGTTYGTGAAMKTDALGHHHLPTPEDLKRVGDAFMAKGVHVHFDVGDLAAYKARGVVPHADWIDNYNSAVADAYLISTGATGGEMIKERYCADTATCQFPDYPGTVGWKLGFQLYRDQPVGNNGEEISVVPPGPDDPPADPPYFNWQSGDKRRRFDRGRKDLFHYVLLAHARARPKSLLPCLKPDPDDLEPPVAMVPTGYDANGTCNTAGWAPNPDFHIPTSVSGVADLPGGDVLITLGLWDEFVARPFVRASTLFHELGHNLELFHGGVEPIWGNKAANTATYIEPNCKPNYLSSMSYMFQVHGLFNDADVINLNYSGPASANLNETATLSDGLSSVGPYRYAWFAPAGSALAAQQGVAAATRFCSGDKFDPASPPASMARVVAASTTSVTPPPGIACTTDWNGDLTCNSASSPDVNFDGTLTASLKGFDDWSRALTRLNQIGAGRRVGKIGSGDFDLLGSGDFDLLGSGDFDLLGSGDFDLLGSGDFDLLGSGDFDLLGSGDFDLLGSGDFDLLGSGQKPIDYEGAKGIGRTAPTGLTATLLGANSCLVADAPSQQYTVGSNYHRIRLLWNATTVGAATYQIQRKLASAPDGTYVDVGTSTANTFDDLTELPDGVNFIYRVRATFTDETGTSAWSRPSQPVTAKNCAAVAGNDPIYTAFQNTTLTVAAPGVRGNDYDVDSPATSLSAIALTQPSTGTLTLNASGGFTYKPKNGVSGTVTFTYTVRNVLPSGVPNVPMSADSNIVTVTITIIKK